MAYGFGIKSNNTPATPAAKPSTGFGFGVKKTEPLAPVQGPQKSDVTKVLKIPPGYGGGAFYSGGKIGEHTNYGEVESKPGYQRDDIIPVGLGGVNSDPSNIRMEKTTWLSKLGFGNKWDTSTDPIEKKNINDYKSGKITLEQARVNVAKAKYEADLPWGESTSVAKNFFAPKTIGSSFATVGKSIFNFFTSSTQQAGEYLGKAAFQYTPESKQVDKLLSEGKISQETYADITGADITNKQVIGAFAGMGLEALSWGSYGQAAKGLKTFQLSKATPTVLKAATGELTKQTTKQILKEAAKDSLKVGTPLGGAFGLTGAMQQNKDTKGLIEDTLIGGLIGGIMQFAISGSIGVLGNQLEKRALKSQTKILDDLELKPEQVSRAQRDMAGKVNMELTGDMSKTTPLGQKIIDAKLEHIDSPGKLYTAVADIIKADKSLTPETRSRLLGVKAAEGNLQRTGIGGTMQDFLMVMKDPQLAEMPNMSPYQKVNETGAMEFRNAADPTILYRAEANLGKTANGDEILVKTLIDHKTGEKTILYNPKLDKDPALKLDVLKNEHDYIVNQKLLEAPKPKSVVEGEGFTMKGKASKEELALAKASAEKTKAVETFSQKPTVANKEKAIKAKTLFETLLDRYSEEKGKSPIQIKQQITQEAAIGKNNTVREISSYQPDLTTDVHITTHDSLIKETLLKPPSREEVAMINEAKEKVAATKKFESRVYERLKAENPELEGSVYASRMNMQEDVQKATSLVESDKNSAYRVAMGIDEAPAGQTSTAVNIVMAEKALDEGNYKLYNQLVKNRSLAQTRRGQEIVAEKGSVTNNTVSRYVKELIKARLEKLGDRYLGDVQTKVTKTSRTKNATKIIDREVKKVSNKLAAKKLDISAAQALIDKLACK